VTSDPAFRTAPRPSRPQLRAWRNAVFVVFGLVGFTMASWLSRVPAARDRLDASTGEMGLLAFAIALGSIAGLVASSHVIARFGTVRTGPLCLAITGVALPIVGLGVALDAFGLVFAALLLYGLATGVGDVSLNVNGAANERAIGRTLMPLFHAMFSVGTVIGVALGALGEVLGVPVLWHLTFSGVVTIVATAIAARYLRPELPDDHAAGRREDGEREDGWRERMAGWRTPRILLIGLTVLGMALAEGSANDWLPLAMVDGHGLDNAAGAAVLGGFLAAMTVGRVAGAPLLDRFGRVAVLRVSGCLAIAGLLVVIVVPNPAVAVVGSIVWGLGAALGFPVGISAAADDPRRAAANVSTVSTIGYFGFLGGPPAIGFLAEHVGLLHALVLVLALVVVATAASGAARKRPASSADER